MADILGEHETHNGGSSSSPKSKADKRKQTIIAITGVVAVLLTYLLWRHSTQSSGSTAQNYSEPTGGTEADNGGGASSPDYSGAMNAIGGQLSTLQSQLTSDESNFASQEEAFNSKISSLTQSVSSTNKKLAHDTTTIQHLEHNKGVQAKKIAILTKELPGHKAKQTAAKHNTSKTKKK